MNRKMFVLFAAVVMLIATAGGAWAEPVPEGEDYDTSRWTSPEKWAWYYYPYRYRMDDVYAETASGIKGQWIIATRPRGLGIIDADGNEYESHRIAKETYPGRGIDDATTMRTRGNAFSNIRYLNTDVNPLEFQGKFVNMRDHVYTMNGSLHARATVVPYMGVPSDMVNSDPLYGDKNIPGVDHQVVGVPHQFLPQHDVRYIFMVVPDWGSRVYMNLGTQDYASVYDDEYNVDVRFGELYYTPTKQPGKVGVNLPFAGDYYKEYSFLLDKMDKSKYDTKVTYANFMLNPREAPAQSVNVPVIISNVAYGGADVNPLDIRITIRENNANLNGDGNTGNIVAYENFKWDVTDNYIHNSSDTKDDDWIFVSVNNKSDIGNEYAIADYILTADIRNFSGLRYALQRYDFTRNPTAGNAPEDVPDKTNYEKSKLYYFDLPADVHDIEDATGTTRSDGLVTIPLDPLSHIAPGLVTRYVMEYSALPVNKRILYLYPPDGDRSSATPKHLTIRHTDRIIRGASVGNTDVSSGVGSSSFGKYKVEGFFLGTLDDKFLAANKRTLDWYGEVNKLEMVDPDKDGSSLISSTSVKEAYVKAGTVRTIEVKVPIPPRLQYNETTKTVGLLPLLITFNLPRNANQHVSSAWEKLLDLWKTDQSGAEFKAKFRDIFELHAYTPDNRDLNISEFFLKEGIFDKNVKVIMDEEKNCITVSFFAILVDSKESWMGLLKDTLMDYLVIRDGDYYTPLSDDQSSIPSIPGDPDPDKVSAAESGKIFASAQQNVWTMKFYVDTKVETGQQSTPPVNTHDGSSGGGCAAGAAASAAIAVLALVCTRRKGDKK